MPFSGGVFTRAFNWVTDRINGIKITATRMDAEMDGMADALSMCVLKDGTQTITNDIPMASHKFTGLSDGTTTGESVHYGQVASETAVGLIELATAAEVQAGTDTTRAVTPALMPYVLIESGTKTAQANCDFAIPTGFQWIELLIDDLTISASTEIALRISTDGGSNYISTANYWYSVDGHITNIGLHGLGNSGQTTIQLLSALSNGSTSPCSIHLRIPTPSSTTNRKTMLWQGSGWVGGTQFMVSNGAGGYIGGNDDITNIRIFGSAGGNTLTLNYRIIGLR